MSMGPIEDARGIFGGKTVTKSIEGSDFEEETLHLVGADIAKGGVEEIARAFDSTIGKTGKVGNVTIERSTKIGQ
jgi:hypothetical protein